MHFECIQKLVTRVPCNSPPFSGRKTSESIGETLKVQNIYDV